MLALAEAKFTLIGKSCIYIMRDYLENVSSIDLDYSRAEIGVDVRHGGRSCGIPPQVRHNATDAPRWARFFW